MGRTHFRSSKSIKDAFAGFSPPQGLQGRIDRANGTTTVAAIFQVNRFNGPIGIGSSADIIVTLTPAEVFNPSHTAVAVQTPEEFAISFAAAITAVSANVTATAIGKKIHVVAAGVATAVVLSDLKSDNPS